MDANRAADSAHLKTNTTLAAPVEQWVLRRVN